MPETNRNSSFELLRIISILGIMYMHSLGVIEQNLSSSTAILRMASDSLFNVGVSCFILISGYFSIRLEWKKLIRLDLMVIFYDIIGLMIYSCFGEKIGGKQMIQALFPIISRKYWFLSCYFFLVILSPFINKIMNMMKKSQARKLLLVLLLLFSVIPTFFYFEIMQDGGKGLIQMIIMYLIGRYIASFEGEKILRKNRILFLFIMNVLVTFILNFVTSEIKGNISTLWSRDCSIFIVVSAVLLFLYFKQLDFYNKVINQLAGNVLAVYVFSPYIQFLIGKKFDLNSYNEKWYLFLIIIIYLLMVVMICVIIEELRKCILGKIENFFAGFIAGKLKDIYKKILNGYFGQKTKIAEWLEIKK